MGRFMRAGVVAGMASLAAAGCTNQAAAPPPPAVCSAPQGASAGVQALTSADTAFAVALFQPTVAAGAAGQNVILSPYSVSATLTMIDVGAAGETDAQIQSVLQLSGNAASLAPAYAALACQDETDGTANGDDLSIANSVWGQQGVAFESTFLSVLSTGYDAPLQQVDFEADPDTAASTIDTWVSGETKGHIPTLLQPGDLDSSARLVLVDAVYFKGSWETAFDPASTSLNAFTLADGSPIQVPTMHGSVTLRSGNTDDVSIYEMGYKGGALAMDFILPTASLADFEASLTPASLGATVALLGAPRSQVDFLLPKFSFGTRVALAPILGALGMPDVFDPAKSNLSGMDGAMDLYVSAVEQQAIIQVDESGTVAAAATSGSVASGAAPVPIAVDEPFLFLIRDIGNGSILFMGHVEDPRQGP
jgi:serpin B